MDIGGSIQVFLSGSHLDHEYSRGLFIYITHVLNYLSFSMLDSMRQDQVRSYD